MFIWNPAHRGDSVGGLEMTNEKKCSKCEQTRDMAEFATYSGKPWCYCKPCQRAASKSYRNRFPERIKAQDKAWSAKNPGYSAAHSRKWRAANPEKVKAQNKADYRRRTEKFADWNRARNLRKNYGLSIEQYEAMYRAQNGVCAICSSVNLNGRRLSVDHNHNTGQVRALLCGNCNIAIGIAKENVEFLRAMISYLEKHTKGELCER